MITYQYYKDFDYDLLHLIILSYEKFVLSNISTSDREKKNN